MYFDVCVYIRASVNKCNKNKLIYYISFAYEIARRPLFRPKPGQKGRNKWRIAINNSEEAKVIEAGELCELLFNF